MPLANADACLPVPFQGDGGERFRRCSGHGNCWRRLAGVHRQAKFKKGAETIEQTDFKNVGFHPMIDMY